MSAVAHAALFAAAFFSAFGIFFNFKRFDAWFVPFYIPLLPLVVAIKMIVYWRMQQFRGTWRYAGMRDILSIMMATHISAFFFILAFYLFVNVYPAFLTERPQFPKSVFLIDWGTTIAFVCGARLVVRLYYEAMGHADVEGIRQCLILGAGDTGEALLREINRMKGSRYLVIGFLDDDPSKLGLRIHDVPVLGKLSEAAEYCERYEIDELLLAMPNAPQRVLRNVVETCGGLNVRFRTIPAMEAVIEGKVTVSQIRDVDIRDLLGREQVELDEARISQHICDKTVLVTGAGGSIGSELCRQIAKFKPARIVLVEQAENNLFEIDREMERRFPGVSRGVYVADICDASRVDFILRTESPAMIFHAAAHKHVPMMEINPGEAVKNNILGTRTIADSARRNGVDRFVMISTDKAVNPTSVMGCSKRVAEMYIQQLRQESQTQFMTVRFGNVLGSSGSVIPIFRKQIAAGGPVTVTDDRMTRYFMTIPEASQLVLQAGAMGSDGDIFVLDMGEPVKIIDLAREMITLSGLRVGEDIEIRISGIRPGEKLYEELSVLGENMGKTTHEKIYVWRNKKEDWSRICSLMEKLIGDADTLPAVEIRERLCEIVPEYRPEALGFENAVATGPAPAANTPGVSSDTEPSGLQIGDSPAT
ncbi:MAG TPA: nucleoside-diphosphate sugar epimerase/dehydratase [Phycisphaerae bacterium]|nr:nucleoside-diphosphate sugar epimerase/dehydratase [Phycisphaerae bacterium]HRW53001.1 nucleoside-diphosphate sugar epimerase/dehydratase [Phycisphaerae bacterium]